MKKILLILTLLFSTSLFADPITHIVFFGDSLTDNGNLYHLLKIIPKSPPYYQGRFSNGPTWAEHVGNDLQNLYGTTYEDYAYGGATAVVHDTKTDSFIAPVILQEELDDYYLHSIGADMTHTLFVIWIGANDYLYETSTDIDGITNFVTERISYTISSLISHGAQNFLILNLPDLSKTPYSTTNNAGARLQAMSQIHNDKLAGLLNNIKEAHPSVNFTTIDIQTILNALLADPSKFNQEYNQNITDTTDSCWLGGIAASHFIPNPANLAIELQKAINNPKLNTAHLAKEILNSPALKMTYILDNEYDDLQPCSNPDQYVFWDDIHPTEAVHTILGQIVEQNLAYLTFGAPSVRR